NDIGDAVIDLRGLVVMREDDRVLFRFQTVDLEDQRRIERPLDLGNARADLFEDRTRLLLDRSGKFEIEAGCEDGPSLLHRSEGVDLLDHDDKIPGAIKNGSGP